MDAALADLVKFAKLYAPRGRVPDPNSERFASARRAASRADKVRHPTPVSGDAWGAKLPVTNPADGVIVPGAFDGKAFAPGQTPVVTAVFTAATKPRGVLGAYDAGHRGRVTAGFEPGHETDGGDVSTDARTAINPSPTASTFETAVSRRLCAPLPSRCRRDRIPARHRPRRTLPERARAMIPLVRAMLLGRDDGRVHPDGGSDDHRRQRR